MPVGVLLSESPHALSPQNNRISWGPWERRGSGTGEYPNTRSCYKIYIYIYINHIKTPPGSPLRGEEKDPEWGWDWGCGVL